MRDVPAPRSPIYRVGHAPDPLSPPDWAYARADGTFGNRFDDPRGRRGVPTSQRIRVLYLASGPAGAYGESVAQFRPGLKMLANLGTPHPPGSRQGRPLVPRDWRTARRLAGPVLHPPPRCVA